MKPEVKVEEGSNQESQETDDKGVPLVNRMKELERKLSEKHDKELLEIKSELAALRSEETGVGYVKEDKPVELDPEAKLRTFVQDPDGYIASKIQEKEDERRKLLFNEQAVEAEKWIKGQPGYSSEHDGEIFRIIRENKLDSPHHWPMDRAKTAWKIFKLEKIERELTEKTDADRRESQVQKTSGDKSGKSASVKTQLNRSDIIKKLAESEKKGDIQASAFYLDKLEDLKE